MKKRKIDSLDDLGRFSEPAVLILISLAEGPKHGYETMLDIERISGQRLGPGTLYGSIARLEERGWIQPLPTDDRRQPYKLTAAGQRVLSARLDSLKAMTRIGQARLSNAG